MMKLLFIIHYLTLTLLILSTFITMSFSSFPLIAWIGLELNSLTFIPLMKNNNNLSSHESMFKYFLIQTITSSLFLTSTLFFHHFSFNFPYPFHSILFSIMSFTLLTKLAAAPFHFWLFPLINSITWSSFIILSTWQKIAPLMMMPFFFSKLVIISIIFSTILPPILMINQNSMKMILGYAAITHVAWLLMTNLINISMLYYYFITYMMNFIPIFYILSCWSTFFLSQTIFIPNKQKLLLFFITLSLSGFPPLMMFMIKITLVLQFSQNSSFYWITMFLLMSSLLTTYSYIYMNFPMLMKNQHLSKTLNSQFPYPLILSSFLPLLSIPISYMLIL